MTEIKPLYWIIVPDPDGYRGELFDGSGDTVTTIGPYADYDTTYRAIGRELRRRRDPHKENHDRAI